MLFVILWFGIRQLSLVGVIAVVVGANILERVIAAVRAARVLRIGWSDASLFGDLPKLAAASIASAAVTGIMYVLLRGTKPLLVLCVSGLVFSLCYGAAVFSLRIPSVEERAYAKHIIARLWRAPWRRAPEVLS